MMLDLPDSIIDSIVFKLLPIGNTARFDVAVSNATLRIKWLRFLSSKEACIDGDDRIRSSQLFLLWLIDRNVSIRKLACKESVGNDVIEELCRNNKALVCLNLSGCTRITDDTVKSVSEKCPQLQTLKLAKIRNLTDASLASLSAGCPSCIIHRS